MKHLTIIVPDGQGNLSTIASIVGAYEIIAHANKYWKELGHGDLFKVELAGISTRSEHFENLVTVKPQNHISAITHTNLIIIPSSSFQSPDGATKGNKMLIDWIANQYKHGAEVASMCTGAFMLASSGLLNGKSCSTHWSAAEKFRALFPEVRLQPDKLITDENGIYTNGGGYSFLNLMLYLVEKYYDRQTAIFCSKMFEIEMDRNSQSTFTIFTGQKMHGDEMVKKAQAYIESNLRERISFEKLSSRFFVSRRNFDRRFVKATGNSPLEYSQRVRVESAKRALETGRRTINEVMDQAGYSDVKAFREVFRKITGMSPLEYRNRYNKEAMV